jgi:hypothetical protein
MVGQPLPILIFRLHGARFKHAIFLLSHLSRWSYSHSTDCFKPPNYLYFYFFFELSYPHAKTRALDM